MSITQLSLSDFRNHARFVIEPQQQFIALHGPNGAGKTNILEAVSLLVPGRGLRRAAYSDLAKNGGSGGFSVTAKCYDADIGTGTDASAPDRRKVRINTANASINALAEYLAVVWLTPAMDRLFVDSPGSRRRFLDRLVLSIDPQHARNTSRYENGLRQRNRLLSDPKAYDVSWIEAVETGMAEAATAISQSRSHMISALNMLLRDAGSSPFIIPTLALDQPMISDAQKICDIWKNDRSRDRAAGRTLSGPHRADLIVTEATSDQAASQCSTGEQKALLLSTILAHAALVSERRSAPPIILLDEIAAHLDPQRRMALFERLAQTGSQIWMTGTEAELFNGIGCNAQLVAIGNS
jgi:DNA replication and repair protein RecF